MIQIYKGIFWYNPTKKKLIVKKAKCNSDGMALEDVEITISHADELRLKTTRQRFTSIPF